MVTKHNLKCPICDNSNCKEEFFLDYYSIYKCNYCSLEFNASFPPEANIEDTFSKKYYREIQKEAFDAASSDYQSDKSKNLYLEGLRAVENKIQGRRLLDVGAGLGVFMKFANDNGWDTTGIEISPYGSKFIKEKYSFNVIDKDITHVDIPDSTFDLITFWDVIEHVEFPKDNLMKAFDLLKPGGLLLITSDNSESLIAGISKFLYSISLRYFKYPLRRTFTPYNRTYFGENSLKSLIKAIGFEILFFKRIQYPIEKLNLSFFEALAIKLLYSMEQLFNLQSQFLLIAKK